MLAALCYVLLILAWILDLLTPQSFVAAILLNGPIALSSLALQSRLTVRLIVLAELANVAAGIVNGLQAGRHWDTIALGDRAISAATFVLVGVLTIKAQESARRAGESEERERRVERERRLRHAMEVVRASLNLELVMRSAVREAARVTEAAHVILTVRQGAFDVPEIFEIRAGEDAVAVRREALPPELSSLVERSRESEDIVEVDLDQPIGRLVGEHAFVLSFDVDTLRIALLIGWGNRLPTPQDRDGVQAFAANLRIALRQARLFIQLAEQNDQIARQKNELQARGDVIRDIVYALAHDLRTPLVAADLTMNQALDGAYGALPERYRDILHAALVSNSDLRRIVETLLLVARYESGEDSQLRSYEPVKPLVNRVVEELRPIADAKSVHLKIGDRSEKAALYADGDEIRRAVTNLAANAIDATPADGTVTIVVRNTSANVIIEVLDEGYGVPAERRAALFERFGGVRGGGGTGLGLYIVRRIAEKYGGRAGYEPRPERGSRFYIELPQAPMRAAM